MTEVLTEVRAHLGAHFRRAGIAAEPVTASVTFLGTEPIEVLRFGPDSDGVVHHVSLGCSRHPMTDPADIAADPVRGPRAEVTTPLRGASPPGLARTLAVLAATPAVDGLRLEPNALVDLGEALWAQQSGPAPFTAVLLGRSDIDDLSLTAPAADPNVAGPAAPVVVVVFLTATPITATEAAWVRLKGAEAMREAWKTDGVDVLDPARRAAKPR